MTSTVFMRRALAVMFKSPFVRTLNVADLLSALLVNFNTSDVSLIPATVRLLSLTKYFVESRDIYVNVQEEAAADDAVFVRSVCVKVPWNVFKVVSVVFISECVVVLKLDAQMTQFTNKDESACVANVAI